MSYITINTSSTEDICKWLNEMDDEFMPPLRNFVEFRTYAEKIFKNASRFEIYKEGKLRGLLAAYFNESEKMAFVTIFGITKGDRTVSDIRKLFTTFLLEFISNPQMQYVELEVHILNKSLLRFYNKLNFKIKRTTPHSYIFEADRNQCEFLVS